MWQKSENENQENLSIEEYLVRRKISAKNVRTAISMDLRYRKAESGFSRDCICEYIRNEYFEGRLL